MRLTLTTPALAALLSLAGNGALAADGKTQNQIDCQANAQRIVGKMAEQIGELDSLSAQLDAIARTTTRTSAARAADSIAAQAASLYLSVSRESVRLGDLIDSELCAGSFEETASVMPMAYSSRARNVSVKIQGQRAELAEMAELLNQDVQRRDDRARAWNDRYGRSEELLRRDDSRGY